MLECRGRMQDEWRKLPTDFQNWGRPQHTPRSGKGRERERGHQLSPCREARKGNETGIIRGERKEGREKRRTTTHHNTHTQHTTTQTQKREYRRTQHTPNEQS